MTRERTSASRLRDQAGHSLVELLVALALGSIVISATFAGLHAFGSTARTVELQNDSQHRVRLALGSVLRELRNVASPQADQPHAFEKAEGTDVVFRSLSLSGASGAGGRRLRYCLDASTPTDGKLWRQTQTWTAGSVPAAPSTTSCPHASWGNQQLIADRLTNATRRPPAPVWSFDTTSASEVGLVRTDLYVDVDPTSGPPASRLTSSVVLRNQNRRPTAGFTATISGSSHVLLNASATRDPEGGVLEYVWYGNGVQIGTGLTLAYAAPGPGTYVFELKVFDGAGLQAVAEPQSVTVS